MYTYYLHEILLRERTDLLRKVLEHPKVEADLPDSKGVRPLHMAANNGNVDIFRVK